MWNCLRGAPKEVVAKGEGDFPQNPIRRKFMFMQSKTPALNDAVAKFDADDIGRRLRADVVAINPKELRRFEAMAAAQLDLNYKALGTLRIPTEAGKLRMNMQDIRRYASGVINNTVRLKEIERLKKLMGDSRILMAQHGIKGDSYREVMADIIHYGAILQRSDKMTSDIARTAALIDYNKFKAGLIQRGVTDETLNKLVDIAQQYAGIKEEVELLASNMGVGIAAPDALEAFPRILTPEMVQRIASSELDETLFEQVIQGHIPYSELLRNANLQRYLPAKTGEVMAARLNSYWQKAGLSMTTSADELNELFEQPLEFRKWLKQHVSPTTLDNLVEEGLFTTIPLSSTEFLDYMRDLYRLPGTASIDKVLELDPLKALDDYTQRLARSAANSSLFNYVRTDGVKDGWAITKDMMKDIAEGRLNMSGVNVSDFVKLSDINWRQLGIDPQQIKVGDFYMHKDAAGLFKSILFVSANPYMMSNLSGAMMRVSSYLRLSVLGGQLWKFANRVTLGNIFQLLHATNLNPWSTVVWTRNFVDVSKALSGKGLEAFDNTKPFIEIGGKTYTRRQAAEQLMNYRSSDALPLTPGEIVKGSYSAGKTTAENAKEFALRLLSPVTGIHRAAQFAQFATKPGKMEPVKFAANFGKYYWRHGIIDGLETLMAPFGGFANMTDVVTRLAMMDMWRGNKTFNSFQEVATLTDEYIPSPDGSGAFTKTYGNLVQPFARFAMWNLPAAIRHATSNPHEFVSYHKILQFMNRSTGSACSTNEAEVKDYQLDGYPLLLGCDGENKVMVNLANWESSTDAVSYIEESAESLAGLFGAYLPSETSKEKRDKLLKGGGLRSAVRSQLGRSYYAGIAEYLLGEDLETGFELDDNKTVTWNGITMTPRLRALVSSAAPILDTLNRENPFGVFGRAEVTDAGGNVIRPEQLGLFGSRRSDKDTKFDDVVAQNKMLTVLRNFAGLNLQVANTALSLQYNDRDMSRSIQEGKKMISTMRNSFVDDYKKMSPGERENRSAKIEELAESVALMEFDYARLQAYMVDKNVLPSEALNKLKEINREDNSMEMLKDGVPYPDLKVQARILEDYYNAIKEVEGE